MDFTTLTFGELLQAGALLLVVILFVRGDIFSKVAVEKMADHGRDMAKITAKEVTKDIKEAVKQGVIEANYEMNGGKKKK